MRVLFVKLRECLAYLKRADHPEWGPAPAGVSTGPQDSILRAKTHAAVKAHLKDDLIRFCADRGMHALPGEKNTKADLADRIKQWVCIVCLRFFLFRPLISNTITACKGRLSGLGGQHYPDHSRTEPYKAARTRNFGAHQGKGCSWKEGSQRA